MDFLGGRVVLIITDWQRSAASSAQTTAETKTWKSLPFICVRAESRCWPSTTRQAGPLLTSMRTLQRPVLSSLSTEMPRVKDTTIGFGRIASGDRKRAGRGKRVSVRVDLGGGRIITKKREK